MSDGLYAMASAMYGSATSDTREVLERQVERASRVYRRGREELIDRFHDNSERLRRYVRGANRHIARALRSNTIREITMRDELQMAPDIMLPYLMAEPTYRRLYRNKMCEGYGDRFRDRWMQYEPEEVPEYLETVNGMWLDTVNDEGEAVQGMTVVNLDPFLETGDLTDIDDQVDIINSWDAMRDIVAERLDPGSIYDDPL